jgi:hypothetical protein
MIEPASKALEGAMDWIEHQDAEGTGEEIA